MFTLKKNLMLVLLIFLLFVLNFLPVIAINAQNSRIPQDNEVDIISLFDGKTLNNWEKTDFGTQGSVYIDQGSIILGMGEGCTGITWKDDFPRINYEVALEAKRVEGYDFFCGMTFPVQDNPCTLIVGGWGGMVVGLSSIDGLDASENSTTFTRSFTKGRWYHIQLLVTTDSIQAWIDGKKVVNFEIGDHKLSIRPEVELSQPFGISSWYTTAALRNIQLKLVNK
jgi:hypothetical protein